jgi:8-oxo-dGTP pyrophosphatase MutT (NUDIX family)
MKNARRLKQETVYQCPWFSVYKDTLQLSNGHTSEYSWFDAEDGVSVVAIDHHGLVSLIREFKYPIQKKIYSLPTGAVEKNETPLEAAKRELREEAGLVAQDWKQLGYFYPVVGKSNFKGICFMATNLETVEQSLDITETISVIKKPLAEVFRMLHANEIDDAWAMLTLMMLENQLAKQT